MAAHIILLILSAGIIVSSAIVLSAVKKYLRSSDKSCFDAAGRRFRISRILFFLLLAVLAFMLIFDLERTAFAWILMYVYMIDTEYWIIPLLYFSTLITAAFLWIYSALQYSEAHKTYLSKEEKTP